MIHFTDDSTVDALMATDHTYEIAVKFGAFCDVGDTTPSVESFFYGHDFTTEWMYEDTIISAQAKESIYDSNPCIGAVTSKNLSLKVYVGEYSPDNYLIGTRTVWVATRIYKSAEPTNKSSWHIVGPWIEDNRIYDPQTGVLTVTATDALSRSDSAYMKIEPTTAQYSDGQGRYCYQNSDTENLLNVVVDISNILGLIGLEQNTYDMLADIQLQLPKPDDETTMRDIIRWAAGICGCNARITWPPPDEAATSLGALVFVPFNKNKEVIQCGSACSAVTIGDVSNTSDYWDVMLQGGADGNDHMSTHTEQSIVTARFQMENPLGTDRLCDSILSTIRETSDGENVWTYRGIQAQNVMLDIRAEAGDVVELEIPRFDGQTETRQYIIGSMTRDYDHLCTASINAPNMARREIDPYIAEAWQ